MKLKKLAACTLLSTTLCSIVTSCGSDTGEHHRNIDNSLKVSAEPTPPAIDLSEVPAQTEESAEISDSLLSVLTGHYSEQEWSSSLSLALARVTYPVISLEDDCSKQYPELNEALESLSKERKRAKLQEYNNLIPQAKEEAEFASEYFEGYSTEEKISVCRGDDSVLSLLFHSYTYSGGPHGNNVFSSTTYDSKTGKNLELSDILKDLSSLPDLIRENLYKNYDPSYFYADLDLSDYFTGNEMPITWTLDYTGITFYFNPYDIGPYASGSFIATLTYDEYPELFQEQYLQRHNSYATEIIPYTMYYIDLDGDGKTEQLNIWCELGNDHPAEKLCISIDDTVFKDTLNAYTTSCFLMHTAENKSYLYVEAAYDNDSRALFVYDLTKEKASAVDFTNCEYFTVNTNDQELPDHLLISNTENFRLQTRTEVFSTINGYRVYSVGDDGMPVSDDSFYVFDNACTFTLLRSLEVAVIDKQSGETMETRTLDAGTKLVYYRTDNETWGDFKLEDGTIIRITLDNTDWPKTINQVDIEEIFDGLFFVG